jgi:hypothetical protein
MITVLIWNLLKIYKADLTAHNEAVGLVGFPTFLFKNSFT